jgi:site-specific DNA recombinase
VTRLRFAHYGRLSTTDKQDPSLSFPSQKKACDRKADDLGGEITCEFTDQESGAKADRPGWGQLMAEASNRETRRFDAVVIYNTARLSRDRVHAALFERELRQVGVAIHYATGGGDPTTAEGRMMIGLQQIFDQFERDKLARETKRGMREATEQGLRVGGRAPYGYRRAAEAMPEGHLGDRTKQRVRLEPDPDQAPVVVEMFHLHAERGLSPKAIADHLNRRGGPPSPRHVDTKRNVRGHWAATTIRSMLNNPVYTGRMVWNRLDFATARETGRGAPRLRAREEWVVCEQAHVPLVSDELFGASQERFEQRPRRQASLAQGRSYLLAGMVHCATGHQPLSMQGKARKDHHYYACSYGATYGDVAACETHAGQKWIYLREDALLPLVHQFFAQRIFGPMRLEKLAKQLRAAERETTKASRHLATRLRQQIADTERRIKLQVQALEDGIEPEIVGARIKELRTDRDAAQADLDALGPDEVADDRADIAARLARLPDLGKQLRKAPPAIQRQTFEAFGLRIAYDKSTGSIEISASITEAVASAFENTKGLQKEAFSASDGDLLVTASDIAGAGFEPATFGL